MASLDVRISKEKSLISKTACFEFAKRFVIRNGTLDLSPVSMRMIAALVNSIAPVLKRVSEFMNIQFHLSSKIRGVGKRKGTVIHL